MEWILARLKEPSTWAGIGVVATTIDQIAVTLVHTTPTIPGLIVAIATGLIAVVSSEAKS